MRSVGREQLWQPINRLTGFPAAIANNAAACERVFQVLDSDPDVKDPLEPTAVAVEPRVDLLRFIPRASRIGAARWGAGGAGS